MRTFDASCWEDYNSYVYKKKMATNKPKNNKIKQGKNKKKRKAEIQKANLKTLESAKQYANSMIANPSELEKRMQQFLDKFNVLYEFQKVFSIKKKSGKIIKFYIADFYIPLKNLIIETDGSFHDDQIEKDNLRTRLIQENYPNVKVLRWRWHDFDSYIKMTNLLKEVR